MSTQRRSLVDNWRPKPPRRVRGRAADTHVSRAQVKRAATSNSPRSPGWIQRPDRIFVRASGIGKLAVRMTYEAASEGIGSDDATAYNVSIPIPTATQTRICVWKVEKWKMRSTKSIALWKFPDMANAAPRAKWPPRPALADDHLWATPKHSPLRKAIIVCSMPRTQQPARPPPIVPRRPPRVRDLSGEIRYLERDIALHPYSESTPRQEPAMTRYCGVQARAHKQKKRARRSRRNGGPTPLMEPEGPAPLAEPEGPAPLAEPQGPAALMQPEGFAPPLAEPEGSAPYRSGVISSPTQPETSPRKIELGEEIRYLERSEPFKIFKVRRFVFAISAPALPPSPHVIDPLSPYPYQLSVSSSTLDLVPRLDPRHLVDATNFAEGALPGPACQYDRSASIVVSFILTNPFRFTLPLFSPDPLSSRPTRKTPSEPAPDSAPLSDPEEGSYSRRVH
ncbi:hypothetical protein BJY52DRAFT_1229166 [Lactarius psammicola]|nr:hypothetical protein BJY52DRAFT_1229166 [Lactarius psammicola]